VFRRRLFFATRLREEKEGERLFPRSSGEEIKSDSPSQRPHSSSANGITVSIIIIKTDAA
jgi:hypothetical protein